MIMERGGAGWLTRDADPWEHLSFLRFFYLVVPVLVT
jgi:hypothetical protein